MFLLFFFLITVFLILFKKKIQTNEVLRNSGGLLYFSSQREEEENIIKSLMSVMASSKSIPGVLREWLNLTIRGIKERMKLHPATGFLFVATNSRGKVLNSVLHLCVSGVGKDGLKFHL